VSLGGTCPALSMSVAGTPVKTNSATVFNNKTCAELKSGDTVYAIGPKQSDGSVLASKIYYVAPQPVAVTVSGPVSGFTGTCPAVQMTVNGTVVKTSSSTTYSGRGCTVLQNGDAVSVEGMKQGDGTVMATAITYTAPATATPTYVTGTVGSLAWACPALTLNISGTVVKTNSATVFTGKGCGDIVTGTALNTSNTKQADGSLLANYVQVVK
jgi:hypothetical protein